MPSKKKVVVEQKTSISGVGEKLVDPRLELAAALVVAGMSPAQAAKRAGVSAKDLERYMEAAASRRRLIHAGKDPLEAKARRIAEDILAALLNAIRQDASMFATSTLASMLSLLPDLPLPLAKSLLKEVVAEAEKRVSEAATKGVKKKDIKQLLSLLRSASKYIDQDAIGPADEVFIDTVGGEEGLDILTKSPAGLEDASGIMYAHDADRAERIARMVGKALPGDKR